MPGDQESLAATFETAAGLYQLARPEYPGDLFDHLEQTAVLTRASRLLEIGCATGKATLPLARRGYRITALEIGPSLAAHARRNLAEFPRVNVVQSSFEAWQPPAGVDFDLVYAATAWHWIDPAVRYAKAWNLLAPGGHLAFWGAEHVFPAGGDRFFHEIQDVYDEIGEGLPSEAVFHEPGKLPDNRAEIEATGLFGDVDVRQFGWEVSYDADAYIRLLDTFSGHIAMAPWQRDRLYGEIRRRLGERPDGRLRRGWGCVLHVARRLDRPAADRNLGLLAR